MQMRLITEAERRQIGDFLGAIPLWTSDDAQQHIVVDSEFYGLRMQANPPSDEPPGLGNLVSLRISPDGRVRFLWDDACVDLRELGEMQIQRASVVDPTPDGRFSADLAKVGGPVLGPFAKYGDAVAAERSWILEHAAYDVL